MNCYLFLLKIILLIKIKNNLFSRLPDILMKYFKDNDLSISVFLKHSKKEFKHSIFPEGIMNLVRVLAFHDDNSKKELISSFKSILIVDILNDSKIVGSFLICGISLTDSI